MPDSRTVLPAPELLDLSGVRVTESAITLVARTSSRLARCPVCGKRSRKVHSRYTRTLADLPWQGGPVTVGLRVRRFFCDQRACNREIFAERLPGIAAHKEQAREEQARRQLQEWTQRTKASGIAELKVLAIKLRQDTEAVVAAMVLCPTARDRPKAGSTNSCS
jgi:transposase